MANETNIQKTIIDELGLSDLSQDKKDQLLIKMTEVILKRIFLETMEKLSESDQKAYENLVDENASPENLEAFLKEKISGYDEMVKKIIEDFKAEMSAEGGSASGGKNKY
jgi:hypothetical protein